VGKEKQVLVYILSFLFFFFACTSRNEHRYAKGGRIYGGILHVGMSENVSDLFPISSNDYYSERVYSQIFEPLLTLDPKTQKVIPCLATSYSVSPDAKKFKFNIRKGVFFHPDVCFGENARELTATDVKFSLEMACSGLKMNAVSRVLVHRIKGAHAFFEQTKHSLSNRHVQGIRVIGKYQLEIELNEPFIGLDKVLTMSALGIFPKEAWDYYQWDIGRHPVGTGPFMLGDLNQVKITLNKNEDYWKKDQFGNKLPFLDGIEILLFPNKKSELVAFRNQQTDLVFDIPAEQVDHVLGTFSDALNNRNIKHKVATCASYNMSFIGFNCKHKLFKDRKIRQAFSLAINRKGLVNSWLNGEGYPADKGFIPTIGNYRNTEVLHSSFNPRLASQLLTEAGYPDARNFPEIDLFVNAHKGTPDYRMCQGIVQQLSFHLGVKVRLVSCTLKERNKAISEGKAAMWRFGWIADYPDAESFLAMLYHGGQSGVKGTRNSFLFENPLFDRHFDHAMMEVNESKRNHCYVQCVKLVAQEIPVIPIYSKDYIAMHRSRVKQFLLNPMQTVCFSQVYLQAKDL
jgi:peptide/nickel transport system substrate-binding protein